MVDFAITLLLLFATSILILELCFCRLKRSTVAIFGYPSCTLEHRRLDVMDIGLVQISYFEAKISVAHS